ncbi:hypothetical protein [Myroides sp. LJL119]
MTTSINLHENEKIELVLKKTTDIPFRSKDYLSVLFIALNLVCVFLILKINLFTIFITPSYLVFLLIFIFSIKQLCDFGIYYYKRYLNAFKSTIILTNKRLVFIDHKKQPIYNLYYNNLPEISYHSNKKGNGYLVIGKKQKIFFTFKFFIFYGQKLKLMDNDLVFFNIKQVQTLYNLLQVKNLTGKA